MMNLELLHWVSDNGGDAKFKEIAITHANTTIKNHYRPNYSAFHVIDYDLETKQVIAKKNHQGNADSSSWSRGQSWGLYGFTMMYRFAKDRGNVQDAERLYNMFLTNQYVKNESSKLKLKQTDANSIAFKSILLGTNNASLLFSNVIENYNYFRSNIDEGNFETILNGLNRLIFVEISLERDKDDPQRIFESLNSTGLDLSQSDLIRNFILMDLPPKDQNRIFETIWNPIEENARDYIQQTSLVSAYIRDYLTLRNKKIPNKNKVYAEFKSIYNNKKDEGYHQELENIKSLSVHYKKFINPSMVEDVAIKRELEYINRLEINVAFPFLMKVYDDFSNDLIDKSTFLEF
jgi:uncharacterized protein with ParB-like and HNH nuclease domain